MLKLILKSAIDCNWYDKDGVFLDWAYIVGDFNLSNTP